MPTFPEPFEREFQSAKEKNPSLKRYEFARQMWDTKRWTPQMFTKSPTFQEVFEREFQLAKEKNPSLTSAKFQQQMWDPKTKRWKFASDAEMRVWDIAHPTDESLKGLGYLGLLAAVIYFGFISDIPDYAFYKVRYAIEYAIGVNDVIIEDRPRL